MSISSQTSYNVYIDPFTPRPAYDFCKRALDIGAASMGLVLLAPVMVGVAVAIRHASPGPVLYRGVRVGRNSKPFHVLKFRTMVMGADRIGSSCTADDDKRITRVGKWLRKTKLDELPQLINVLKGEMSLVGPRPEIEEFTRLYDVRQQQILLLRPGITDFATMWDSDEGSKLAGQVDPGKAYLETILPTKLELQLKYLQTRSLWVDVRLLVGTVALVLKRLCAFSLGMKDGVKQS
jgi:lipopolysaccharide/colanic/teichoic acid biosynthesis glycosyltransferase